MGNSTNHNEKSHRYKLLPPLYSGYYGQQSLGFNPGYKISLENRMLDRKRATGLSGQKNMVDSCITSRPVSTQRGTPTEWLNASSDQRDQTNVFQGQISFQPPDNSVNPKRGLSGSRLQQNSLVPRVGSQSSRRSAISYVSQDQDVPVTPSSRPASLKFSARFSKGLLVNDGRHLLNNYRWNSSDQRMRFQLQLSKLNTSRTIKRSSEAVSHRTNPMYCVFGSRLPLLNRSGLDSDKTERKRTCDSRVQNDTLQPVKPVPPIKDEPLSEWSGGTYPESDLDNSFSVTNLNSTCDLKEPINVASETWSSEADPEAEATNVHYVTPSSEISLEAEATYVHHMTPSSEISLEAEATYIHLVTTSSEMSQESDATTMHPVTTRSEKS